MKYFTSIILPFYNRWDLTLKSLKDLYDHTPENSEVILVNDASTDSKIAGGIGFWQQKVFKERLRYVRNETNLGFGGSHNRGATFAKGDILVFLSNDVLIYSPFVQEIEQIIDENPNVLIGGEIIDFPSGWNDIDDVYIPYCNGWLIACTKDVWSMIGGWDSLYSKMDYEDIDVSLTALSLGIELRALKKSKLKHLGGQTIASLGIDRQAATLVNREKFREKWSGKVEFVKNLVMTKHRVCTIDQLVEKDKE